MSRRRSIASKLGLRRREESPPHPDAGPDLELLEPGDREIVERSMPYSMTSVARLQAVIDSVRHCQRRGIGGAFVECGVWRGGSVLAMILTLQDLDDGDRDIFLFDTFEGMTEPTEHDVSEAEGHAVDAWRAAGGRPWPDVFGPEAFNEENVRATLAGTGYPQDRLHIVRGRVEDTIPEGAPEAIALLRLDTDWYESTRHELVHLYPRLASGGVLIVDDYGHWQGCRRAVDEYFATEAPPVLLTRLDYTGRLAVKA